MRRVQSSGRRFVFVDCKQDDSASPITERFILVALGEKLFRNDTRPRSRGRRRQFAPSAGIPVRCTADMLPGRCRRDKCGAIAEAYDTDAYGNTLIFTAPGPDGVWFTDDDVQSNYGANGVIYCGYRFDPGTQNYYVRNRTYNPALGRWLQRDPIEYDGGINLYGYVDSAPVGLFDPNGMAAQAPKLHVIVGNDFNQFIDDIEFDLQRAGKSFQGWTKKGAANYVGFVMRRASFVHFAEVGAAKAALKLAIRLATLLNADNPIGWAAGVLGFKGKQAIKLAIKLAKLHLAQIRASNGADEVYRGFYQTKLNNGWNAATILVYYDPFTSTFAGSISGSVGQVTDAGVPNGVGCIHKFFFYFTGAANAQNRAVNFQY